MRCVHEAVLEDLIQTSMAAPRQIREIAVPLLAARLLWWWQRLAWARRGH